MDDIRLVATDLDGTLVRTDRSVSPRTRAALQAVERSGRMVVFVTGRPPRWIHEVAEATGRAGIAICSNGALRYDPRADQILSGHFLEPELQWQLVARLREAVPGVVFAVEYGPEMAREPAYTHFLDIGAEPIVGSVEEITARPAAKLLVRHYTLGSDDLLAAAIDAAGDLATFTHSVTSGPALLEISVRGITKASGLAEFAAEHDVNPAQVLAFGDMPNDLAMLAWAGRSVAVANAHPEVRAAADEITGTNDDDGVAAVLERLLA